MSSLAWSERYSVLKRDDLVLYYPRNSSGINYTLRETAIKPISSYFPKLLTLNMTGSTDITTAIAELLGRGAVGYSGAWIDEAAYPRSLRYTYQAGKPFDLAGWFAALGASLTNEMRRNGGTIQRFDDGPTSNGHISFESHDEPVRGLIGVATTYYSVEWGWIALHGAMLLGGLLFCQLTVRNSSRPAAVRIWKGSSLAVMRQGRETGQILAGSKTVGEIKSRARGQKTSVALPDCEQDLIALPTRETNDGHGV